MGQSEYVFEYGNPPGVGFWALVREDLKTNSGDWTTPGFRALFVHRFGNWRMGIGRRWIRMPISAVYRMLYRYVRNHYGVELDQGTRIGRRVAIDHQSGIVLSAYSSVGDDCRLRQNTTIGIVSLDDFRAAPRIGRGVDIGAGAVILGPITVGDGAAIGANAVVLKDVPAGALAVGVPARIIERTPAGMAGARSRGGS
jgi:serine O-acetyltransferase